MRPDKTATLFALLLAALVAGSAQADRRTSLEDAVSEARDRYPGRVISAETRRRDGRESHRIRILTDDGRVKRLDIDAESGRFERRRSEDHERRGGDFERRGRDFERRGGRR